MFKKTKKGLELRKNFLKGGDEGELTTEDGEELTEEEIEKRIAEDKEKRIAEDIETEEKTREASIAELQNELNALQKRLDTLQQELEDGLLSDNTLSSFIGCLKAIYRFTSIHTVRVDVYDLYTEPRYILINTITAKEITHFNLLETIKKLFENEDNFFARVSFQDSERHTYNNNNKIEKKALYYRFKSLLRTNKLGGKNKPKKDLKTFLSKLHKLIIEFE
tara:strand:+ start:7339 stop:8001 length:663 start_codon:yes stop_codon:yes gene_type:complete